MLANRLAGNFAISEENILLNSSQSVANRMAEVYERQFVEAQRLVFTDGVTQAIQTNNTAQLLPILESIAATGNLDSVIVTDLAGVEIAGVVRVETAQTADFSLSSGSNLAQVGIVERVTRDGSNGATGLMLTPEGTMFFVGVPVRFADGFIGGVFVGRRMDAILADIRASAVADVTLYDEAGLPVQTTFALNSALLTDLRVPQSLIAQTLSAGQPVLSSITLNNQPYRAVFSPFTIGDSTLGIIATTLPDNVPFAAALGTQLTSLLAATFAGVVVIVGYLVLNRLTQRLDAVAATTRELAQGKADSRTGLKAVDEVGVMGQALDAYADHVQIREDQFRKQLRRERRERAYFLSVLEAMPDGVIVQDQDGQLIMMNDRARALLGTQTRLQINWQQIADAVLGSALAPGLYALGDPQQISHDGRMLSAQAAAVMSPAEVRIGTVTLLRDITEDVQQAQAQEELLKQLSSEIQQPLASLAISSAGDANAMVSNFAREISRHAAGLQKMIVDMRELTRYSDHQAAQMQRPLSVDTLVLAVANDWRQIAQAAGLDLQVSIDEKGLFILGDESRLRWALGNVVDNAIKYTPNGGIVSLEVRGQQSSMAQLRVRDNGTGIAGDDLANIFMPFYRGTPLDAEGQVIRVPGMGQGIPLAKQVIEAHGGRMKIKSKPQVGTAVYFALPLTSGESIALPLFSPAVMEGETIRMELNLAELDEWERP